jgi:hypothetical protein
MTEEKRLWTMDEVMNYKETFWENIWNNIKWPTKRFIDKVTNFPYQVKWFIQRGKRGWADCDVWSVDYYLTPIIIGMLKKLKETTHGYPYGLTEKKWDKTLDKMVAGFEAAQRVLDDDYYKDIIGDDPKWGSVPRDIIKKLGRMSVKDQKLFRKNAELFIEYYFALWD